MYRRAVVVLYRGGRGQTEGALITSRYTNHILKCFSLGSAHCSEKKPPENPVGSDPPAEEKTDVPHKDDSSQPSQGDNVKNILSGMKVEVSAENMMLLAKKKGKKKKKSRERAEGMESASKMFQMASGANLPDKKEAVSAMDAAVSAVASTFPQQKKNQVESELLQQLRLHKQMAETQKKKDLNISKVIAGMQIKQRPDSFKEKRQEGEKELWIKSKFIAGMQINQRPDSFKAKRQEGEKELWIKSSQKLFTGKRLKIFPAPPVSEQTTITVAESCPTLWDIELAKEIAAACEKTPRNGFEEMIQWTNEGKLWTFPINNEVGLDEEQEVEFHEHIFLDKYLEDFPNHGPIRHFMELVVCGLSKNPYLTVQQKKEHIDWFRNYFNQKEDILRECEVYLN